ncbi:MAG: hypothetical protein HYV26_08700 [Candidatus Hydrogenedentes bacterium]|nr:hypothetical protein [Candidatus Hydrogenedentota bacterium]
MRNGVAWACVAALSLSGLLGCAPAPDTSVDATALYVRSVSGNIFDTAPVRGALRPLRFHKAGFDYRCTECHLSILPPARQNPQLPEHANIVLEHGMNTNCLNCHHPKNRDAYVDHEGGEIPSDQPARLCSKCHGPTYREWELGIHGRANGYWDTRQGPRERLLCVQCHDPHAPRFKPMTPEAPPQRTRFAARAEHAPEYQP